MKPKLPDLLETIPNTSPTLTSLTTSLARFFQSPAENNNSGSTKARALFRTEEVHHSHLSSKLGKDGH